MRSGLNGSDGATAVVAAKLPATAQAMPGAYRLCISLRSAGAST
eukprot:gene11255-biopygen8092